MITGHGAVCRVSGLVIADNLVGTWQQYTVTEQESSITARRRRDVVCARALLVSIIQAALPTCDSHTHTRVVTTLLELCRAVCPDRCAWPNSRHRACNLIISATRVAAPAISAHLQAAIVERVPRPTSAKRPGGKCGSQVKLFGRLAHTDNRVTTYRSALTAAVAR